MRKRLFVLQVVIILLSIGLAGCTEQGAPPRTADQFDYDSLFSMDSARKLLNEWQDSQNDKQFEVYAGLFASDFKGVKKVGANETSFDRDQWLVDRKKMFQFPFIVRLSSIQFYPLKNRMEVRFVQEFESTGFMDRGNKVLELAYENDVLKIRNEIMLDSTVLDAPSSRFTDPLDFRFVVRGKYMVISDLPENIRKIEEEFSIPMGFSADEKREQKIIVDQIVVASLGLDMATVPDVIKNRIGETVYCYDEGWSDEPTSEKQAKITGIKLIYPFYSHWGMQEYARSIEEVTPAVIEDLTAQIRDVAIGSNSGFLVYELEIEEQFGADFVSENKVNYESQLRLKAVDKNEFSRDEILGFLDQTDFYSQIELYFEKGESRTNLDFEKWQIVTVCAADDTKEFLAIDFYYLPPETPPYAAIAGSFIFLLRDGTYQYFDRTSDPLEGLRYFFLNDNVLPDFITTNYMGDYYFYLDGKLTHVLDMPFYDCID